MANEFTSIIEQDGEWFVAYSPEVPGANGQGRSPDAARENLAEAIALILEDRREEQAIEALRDAKFEQAAGQVLEKNAELYRRLNDTPWQTGNSSSAVNHIQNEAIAFHDSVLMRIDRLDTERFVSCFSRRTFIVPAANRAWTRVRDGRLTSS